MRPQGLVRAATDPNEWVKALSGAALHWRFARPVPGPAGSVHEGFQREIWGESSAAGRAGLLAGALLAPAGMLLLSALMLLRNGVSTRRRSGVGLRRQLGQQLHLATTRCVPPYWYYLFDLYEEEKRRRAGHYLYRFETKNGVYAFLRRYLSDPDSTEALSDKARFAWRCAEHGVAAIPVLLAADRGALRQAPGAPRLPRADLFQKPLRGAGGRGARVWIYRDGRYHSAVARLGLDAEGLRAHLRRTSRSRSWVLRPRVRCHPSLDDLDVGALNTLRVLSCLDERGEPEITHAVFRMARRRGSIVDNFHAGGIAARVDLATGELGAATDMGTRPDTAWWTHHPTTGAAIEGRRLAAWSEVIDLVHRAHRAFPDQVAVGWDVGLLPAGPALVEGNKSPDLDILQRSHGQPAGSGRLGELLAFHLERARRARAAAAAP